MDDYAQLLVENELRALLYKLSNLCPSDEGLGGRAPLGAFYQVAWEARQFFKKYRTPEQRLTDSYMAQLQKEG
jgi:hypothetical protein